MVREYILSHTLFPEDNPLVMVDVVVMISQDDNNHHMIYDLEKEAVMNYDKVVYPEKMVEDMYLVEMGNHNILLLIVVVGNLLILAVEIDILIDREEFDFVV